MDDACPQGRSGGTALPAITRRAPAVVLRTTGSPARPAAPGRRSLGLPGRCVDTQPGGRRDWGFLHNASKRYISEVQPQVAISASL
jgi:hypothetical protein